MIAKLETGNGFGGALRYDVRAGKGTPKELAKVLDVSGVSFDFDDKGELLINPKQVGFDFRQQTMGYTGKGVIRKPVYHWALSYHPDDKVSEEQMTEDAKEFLQRIGFDDTQYVMTVHYDKEHDHLHIVTNVVNNQGKRIPTMGLIDKAHAAAAAITKERGYIWGEKMKEENITEDRMHKPHERVRKMIEPMIREALSMSISFHDFQDKLIIYYGIMCNYTVAKDGNRGRLSFCYEYEDQKHSFKGSSVARDLSFVHVNEAIQANCKLREAARIERVNKNSYLNSYNNHYKPLIAQLKESCDKAFSMYSNAKDRYGVTSQAISDKYNQLRSAYAQMKAYEVAVKNASTAKGLSTAAAVLVGFLNPFAGFIIGLVGRIIAESERSAAIETKRGLRAQAQQIRNEIEELKQQQAELKQEKTDTLRAYVESKEAQTELFTEMNALRDHLLKPVEAPKPKIKFDFKAAAQKSAQTQAPCPAQATPASSSVNIYTVMMNARTREEFNTSLLSKMVSVDPMFDRYGGVADFKVILARESKIVNASSLMSSEQFRSMLDRWETWTKQAPAYKLAIEREHREKLADICRKMDQRFPDGAPRMPKGISFRTDGTVADVAYCTGRGEQKYFEVAKDGYIRWNDGSAYNIHTGKYYEPRRSVQQNYDVSESRGTGKGIGRH